MNPVVKEQLAAFLFTALLATLMIAGLTWKYGVYGAFAAMFVAQLCIGASLWIALAMMIRSGVVLRPADGQ
jgi:hypothetical protein